MPSSAWRPSLKLYDRTGGYKGVLAGTTHAVWTQGVDGTDTLELRGSEPIGKDERVVWCDWAGAWHEHMATAPSARREGSGGPEWRTQLKTSLCELSRSRPGRDEYRPTTALAAAQHATAGTRWGVGEVDSTGDGPQCELYRVSCLGCVTAAAETFGLEPYATYAVGDAGVASRTLNLHRRGSDRGRRFEYGRDLASVKAEYSSEDVVTALRGLGKGEPTEDGHGRRITFADVNEGLDYVEDVEATAVWGMPGPGGTMLPAFADVVFEGVDDPEMLLDLTRAELERRSSPQVSYEMDVVGAAGGGLDALDVSIGDAVEVVDPTFPGTLRVSARVVEAMWDLLALGKSRLTLGTPRSGATDIWSGLAEAAARTSALSEQSAAWDDSSGASSGYLRRVMAGISELCNAGLSYKVESETLGIMCANVPLDPETGAPLAAAAGGYRCINLRAGVLRISSEYSNGQWVWTTAATGTGIVADVVNAGVLRCGNNVINLGTGEMYLSAAANLGGKTVQQVLAFDGLDQGEVFNRLTNGGQAQGIYMSGNQLYINGQYIAADTIELNKLIGHSPHSSGYYDYRLSFEHIDVDKPDMTVFAVRSGSTYRHVCRFGFGHYDTHGYYDITDSAVYELLGNAIVDRQDGKTPELDIRTNIDGDTVMRSGMGDYYTQLEFGHDGRAYFDKSAGTSFRHTDSVFTTLYTSYADFMTPKALVDLTKTFDVMLARCLNVVTLYCSFYTAQSISVDAEGKSYNAIAILSKHGPAATAVYAPGRVGVSTVYGYASTVVVASNSIYTLNFRATGSPYTIPAGTVIRFSATYVANDIVGTTY